MLNSHSSLSTIFASPVGAANRVYFVGRNGVSQVIKQTEEFWVLATNTLDDKFDASPAIVGDELFLKGKTYLYCIAKPREKKDNVKKTGDKSSKQSG